MATPKKPSLKTVLLNHKDAPKLSAPLAPVDNPLLLMSDKKKTNSSKMRSYSLCAPQRPIVQDLLAMNDAILANDQQQQQQPDELAISLGNMSSLNDNELFALINSKIESGKEKECLALLQHVNASRLCLIRDEQSNCSLLHRAAKFSRISIVQFLLDNGVPIDDTDQIGATPLMHAAISGATKSCGYLLSKGAASINTKDHYENSALSLALKHSHMDVVNTLLLYGADINTKAQKGSTVLMIACEEGNMQKVQYLVEKGASISRTNRLNENCLYLSLKHSNITHYLLTIAKKQHVLQKLLFTKDDVGQNALHKCIEFNNYAVFLLILDACSMFEEHILVAFLNEVDILKNNTPLLLAVQNDHFQFAKVLCACAEVQVNVQNSNGDTALHMAITKNSTSMIASLIENGASKHIKNKQGSTPAMLAKKMNLELPKAASFWQKVKTFVNNMGSVPDSKYGNDYTNAVSPREMSPRSGGNTSPNTTTTTTTTTATATIATKPDMSITLPLDHVTNSNKSPRSPKKSPKSPLADAVTACLPKTRSRQSSLNKSTTKQTDEDESV